MGTVTIHFSSIDADELRRVGFAHAKEHRLGEQPKCVQTSVAKEQDHGEVGMIVRPCGSAFEAFTMPVTYSSAMLICAALTHDEAPDEALPYGLTGADLHLDSSSVKYEIDPAACLRSLLDMNPSEQKRVLRAADALLAVEQDATVFQALDTAMIWERG